MMIGASDSRAQVRSTAETSRGPRHVSERLLAKLDAVERQIRITWMILGIVGVGTIAAPLIVRAIG